MKCCFLVLLMLTISCEVVTTEQFLCGMECTITGVTMNDTRIQLQTLNYNYNYQHQTTVKLTILNSTMDEILPIAASSGHVNLNYLSCVSCGLTEITKHSFTHSLPYLSSLEKLDISVGSFSKLQKKLFSPLTTLQHLNVSHGVIDEVDDTAFFNLGSLTNLDLSHNNISKISPNMFVTLTNLLNLDVSYNHIETLDDGLFANNTKLENIIMAHNVISKIDGRLLCPQCVISSVNLSYNNLKQLHISSKVKRLTADNNVIEIVTCDVEGTQLSNLNLTNNSLGELGGICSLTQLTKLSLSYNNLGKLNHSSFAALTVLTELHLKSANISRLEYGVFSHQTELQILDLSYNRMGNIVLDVLLAARNLQFLYIDGNDITELSYIDLRKSFSSLSTIGISDNDFNCTFLGQVIKRLNSDNISTTVSSVNKVTNTNNINGIGCKDRKETTTSSWITSLNTNDNTTSAIIQQVEKLSDDISAVKQQNYKMNNEILTIQADVLKIELTKNNNMSSASSDTMWTQMNQLNNITLEKQQISHRTQMQQIVELKFKIEQNSQKITDCASEIEKLAKEMKILQSSSTGTNKTESTHPDLQLMKNVNIILITLIVAFCTYKGYKFVRHDTHRFARYNTTNTLHANIIEMDSNSNK